MNTSPVTDVLYGFFGLEKNKLTWLGTLKAFVLTEIDESTAESTTWKNNEENLSESLNIHESDEATNSKLDMVKQSEEINQLKEIVCLKKSVKSSDLESQVLKEPALEVSKKQRKSQRKKMKAKEGIELAEKNASPHCQEHAASTSGMEKVNDDVAATMSKNKAKEVVVIAGDSLIKNVVGASISKTDSDHFSLNSG
ncbi:Hypothetical predicted protein [Paramuricea clavata]|uniref:Uncharacterized protein n=1 Tax=Paramuricea clavata TaxID=317549 RepID=A0A7D9IGC8_PARCT|nr:Hypothetical predicted protein [Paramuricea clavata]